MKNPLVIGGDGFIGSALVRSLIDKATFELIVTSRRQNLPRGWFYLNLEHAIDILPFHDVCFIVAAVNGFQGCEGNPISYRVNVDAPIAIAKQSCLRRGFPVFISSDSVEWCGTTAYARQKALAEIGVTMCNGAIVRSCRITAANLERFIEFLISVGINRVPGIFRFE